MALRFYYGSGSPYGWRVWLALEYKQIPYELHQLSFSAGDLKKPDFTAINPRQKIPALVDGKFALYESVAMVEYLEEKKPSPSLFPGDSQQRALIRLRIQEADHYFSTAMERLVQELLFKPEDQWDRVEIEEAKLAVIGELRFWEKSMRGDFLCGQLSAADFTLYPLVALCLRMEEKKMPLGLRESLGANFQKWMRRLEDTPEINKTWPPHWQA